MVTAEVWRCVAVDGEGQPLIRLVEAVRLSLVEAVIGHEARYAERLHGGERLFLRSVPSWYRGRSVFEAAVWEIDEDFQSFGFLLCGAHPLEFPHDGVGIGVYLLLRSLRDDCALRERSGMKDAALELEVLFGVALHLRRRLHEYRCEVDVDGAHRGILLLPLLLPLGASDVLKVSDIAESHAVVILRVGVVVVDHARDEAVWAGIDDLHLLLVGERFEGVEHLCPRRELQIVILLEHAIGNVRVDMFVGEVEADVRRHDILQSVFLVRRREVILVLHDAGLLIDTGVVDERAGARRLIEEESDVEEVFHLVEQALNGPVRQCIGNVHCLHGIGDGDVAVFVEHLRLRCAERIAEARDARDDHMP